MKRGCLLKGVLLTCVALFLLFALAVGAIYFVQIPLVLMFGWITFLRKVIPRVTVDPAAIAVGAVSVILLFAVVHRFFKWLYANYGSHPEDVPSRPQWKPGWTCASLSIFILMFVTSIALTGLIHQVKWLYDKPIVQNSWEGMHTRFALRDIGRVLENYKTDNTNMPVALDYVPVAEIACFNEYKFDTLTDEWGTPFQYSSDGSSYTVRSFGKNKIIGGGMDLFDDLVLCNGDLIFDERNARH